MDLLLAVLGRGDAPPLDALAPPEWSGLVEVACQHGVASLLHHRLAERGEAACAPDAIRRRLSQLHMADALRAEARRLQLAEILTALRRSRVPAVLLKGAHLAEHAYASPALRPMGDIDLLVPPEAFETAMETLLALDYEAPDEASRVAYQDHRHPPPLRRRGHLTVELHVGIEPCMAPFRMPLADVWRRTRPVRAAGECALALAPEDLLLHLATHMGHSHLIGVSLISAYDVAAWSEVFGATVDWDALVQRAVESGTRRFVYVALELARAAFAIAVPRQARDSLRDEADDATVVDALRVLRWPRHFPDGPLGLLTARPSMWGGVRRMTRLLVVEPLQRRRPPTGGIPDDDVLARWTAAARFLLSHSSRAAVREQTARVRRLRRWARGAE